VLAVVFAVESLIMLVLTAIPELRRHDIALPFVESATPPHRSRFSRPTLRRPESRRSIR
jgi:hypothetical protein